jgi:hypothetical protein
MVYVTECSMCNGEGSQDFYILAAFVSTCSTDHYLLISVDAVSLGIAVLAADVEITTQTPFSVYLEPIFCHLK